MAHIVLSDGKLHRLGDSITSSSDSYLSVRCDSKWQPISISPNEYIEDRIQEALSGLKSKLSSMECSGCGGNIDVETLKCTCCGRQYRLVAENDG